MVPVARPPLRIHARAHALVCVVLAVGCAKGSGTVLGDEPALFDPVVQTPPDGAVITQDPEPLYDASVDDAPGPARDGAPTAARDVSASPTDARPAGRDPCTGFADGTYCAGLLGLPSGGLLRCRDGVMQGIDACMSGCLDRMGATDACLSDAVEPCFNETDGNYCGSSIGSTTRPNDLYLCRFRRTSRIDACRGGCDNRAGGTDLCRP